ncbi:MAG: 16S rRNA (cytosine(967)-C(5))-methyltransferase RsmB [Christensenellales bacterium]
MSEKDKKGPYGKPAPRPEGERKYGRPAGPSAEGERKFGRPAAPKPEGERKYARPAGPRPEGERKFGRPAAPRPEGERKFGRPAAPKPEGEARPLDEKPLSGKPASPEPGFAKPGFSKPGSGRPSFGKPSFGKPSFGKHSFGRPSFSRPAQGKPAFPAPRPAAPRAPQPPAAPSLTSDARRSALQVLNRVLLDAGFASLSLDEQFNMVYLSPRDKRLCTNIVYLTLENLNRLDFALDRLLEEPERLEKRVRNLLRLSACQILLLDRVPDSAVVNEAVNITRDMGLEDLTALVNGVLRNLIRTLAEIPWPKPEEGLPYYTVMHSLPAWFVTQVLADYGQETGHSILTWRKARHGITLRPNLGRVSEEKFGEILDKKAWKHEKGLMPAAWQVYGASDISRDNDFLDGSFSIQGEGSMVAAEAAFLKLGAQVLDACAAPGGKSAYLAEKMQGTGRIHAWDVHEHRVELTRALADRLRLYNIRPAVRDALVWREQLEATMDVVLIDAPCTGSGVLDDKPDLKARLQQESLQSLMATQKGLLDTCCRYVKPGGLLVYATCSLLPDENSRQVEAFLHAHPDFRVQPLPESIPAVLRQHEGPLGLQLLPHRDGTEGFFVARMQRL